ncbi:TIGR01458 family HAD-type hydrolase [Pelagibius marinus]|uniref:TIGR01458 family HAD-type hydrolase n=1 Tax=Pelagibius marinus TaxID=2762760 RepID=UPI0018723F6C|nr:TIGR01458 family HAD-type hydrolase [Pelagibius marinus]
MAFKGLLLDLEGVLHQGDEPIPGAAAALRELQAAGLAIRYLTNTTTRPRRAIAARLQALSFVIEADEVFSPPAAAARLLADLGAKRIHLAAAPELAEDLADFEIVGEDEVDAVVVGDLYKDFTWDRLNGLFQRLAAGAVLVALHKNRVSRREAGISLDLGPFVAALEYAAGVEARVVGKPAKDFFDLALGSLGLAPREVLMVGDDIEADIGGALAAGLAAVQVKTGKYRPQDDAHPSITPTGRIETIADLSDWLAGLTG